MASTSLGDEQTQPTSPSTFGGASSSWEQQLQRNPLKGSLKNNLRSLPVSGHAPIGIDLRTPQNYQQHIQNSSFSPRHLIDGLLREIKSLAPKHKRRQAPFLNWVLPHALLDSADVTEIMYFLGRQFHLGEIKNYHYNVAFNINELNESRAALFKGLGFNSLEVQLNDHEPFTLDAITRCMEIANDFNYTHFALNLPCPIVELGSALKEISNIKCLRPDSITVSDFPSTEENGHKLEQLYTSLRDMGYRVLGNDCFISSGSPLSQAQIQGSLKLTSHGYNCQNVTDILGIGPGNLSSCGSSRFHNPEELRDYLVHDFTDRPCVPFLHGSFKPVLEQLLCYHQLDLKYFRDRYNWSLIEPIEKLWAPLQTYEDPLYTVHKDTLYLTSRGILKLSLLCKELLSHLEEVIPPLPNNATVGK